MNNIKPQKNILEEWQKIKVEEIFDFLSTYAISRDNLENGILNGDNIGNIHYGDIHARYKTSSIDLNEVAIPRVKDKYFSPSEKDFLKDGDLVMADVSEDYEGIGEAISIHGIGNKKVVGGLHTFVLRDNNGRTDERYRQYIFKNPEVRNKFKKIANGVSVYGISKSSLLKFTLNVPNTKEQKRITAVLEVWDQAIEKLAKKIEIKKNIKKGLMQNLLTGKIRLPGFNEKWQTMNLGVIGDIISGGTPDTTNRSFWGGKIQWITPTEITKLNGGKYIKETKRTITDLGLKNSSATLIPKNSLILCSRATIGDCAINLFDVTTNQGFKNVIPKNIQIDFLYYLMLTKKHYLKRISSGSTFLEFSKKDLEKIKIFFPKEKKEQLVIANILTAADIEIEKLEKKLFKLKDQKKYLLNNLITGQIRTPENLS